MYSEFIIVIIIIIIIVLDFLALGLHNSRN